MQLDAESGDAFACHFGDARGIGTSNDEQLFNTSYMRRADAELGKMGTN